MNTASKTAEYSDNPSKTSYMSMGMIALAITIVATASLWYRWFKRTNASTRLKFQLTRIKAKQSRMEAGFRLLEPNAREPFTKPMWSYTLRIARYVSPPLILSGNSYFQLWPVNR